MPTINFNEVLEALRPYATDVSQEFHNQEIASLSGERRRYPIATGFVSITLRVPNNIVLGYVSTDELAERHDRLLRWLLPQINARARAGITQLSMNDIAGDDDLSLQIAAIKEIFDEFERAHDRLRGKKS